MSNFVKIQILSKFKFRQISTSDQNSETVILCNLAISSILENQILTKLVRSCLDERDRHDRFQNFEVDITKIVPIRQILFDDRKILISQILWVLGFCAGQRRDHLPMERQGRKQKREV